MVRERLPQSVGRRGARNVMAARRRWTLAVVCTAAFATAMGCEAPGPGPATEPPVASTPSASRTPSPELEAGARGGSSVGAHAADAGAGFGWVGRCPDRKDAPGGGGKGEARKQCWSALEAPANGWTDGWRAHDGTGHVWRVWLARREDPTAARRALAAARIADALGFSSVAQTEGLRIAVGEVGALLGHSRVELEQATEPLVVGNDGAIQALAQRVCDGRPLDPRADPRVLEWARVASQEQPPTSDEARAMEPYLQMVVLDLLTANLTRRWLWFDEQAGAVCLDGLEGAFPGFVAPKMLDALLGRVRPIRHFPASLEEALTRLDRPAVETALVAGPFADWLVAPREVTDLLERRAALRTLVYARRIASGR